MNNLGNSSIEYDEFVFGGTFDPVHQGHLAIVEAITKLQPEFPVRLIPCAIPALKGQPSASFAHRVAMLKLALANFKQVTIDERECQRAKKSYSIDTIKSLRAEFPKTRFWLVMGMDSFNDLPQWQAIEELSQLCNMVVVNRHNSLPVDLSAKAEQVGLQWCSSWSGCKKMAQSGFFLLKMPEKTESSTKIRKLGGKHPRIDTMVPQSVIEYIRQNYLYKSEES
ncbi:nicotinate (nicotinamide) nucleotide adenylyltransferase [Aliikangiella sp. IMCC44632]